MAVKKSRYPWVTFRINEGNYCISSKFVATMMQKNNFQPLPDTSECFLGVFEMQGDIIPVVDMRRLLGMPPAFNEKEFLLEMKAAHLHWVEVLEESARNGAPFPLERSPELCAFGSWRKGYQAENSTIRLLLQQMDDPHAELHHLADLLDELQAAGDRDGIENLVEQADKLCRTRLLPLFDRLIKAGEEANQGILVVLELGGKRLAMRVDEIIGVLHFNEVSDESVSQNDGDSPYVSSIITNAGCTYFKLSADALSNLRD